MISARIKRTVEVGVTLEDTAAPLAHLSPSLYDVAMVAMVPGVQQQACLEWLLTIRHDDQSWGAAEDLNWHDAYVSTYAASTALLGAGLLEPAESGVATLAALPVGRPQQDETMAFGLLITTLDRIRSRRGQEVPAHPPAVRQIMAQEQAKWRTLRSWDGYFDPTRSIAGFCAEHAFGDESLDLRRLVDAFQVANGSIANSPGASAAVLLEAQRRGWTVPSVRFERLQHYVETRVPQQTGYLDDVTCWLDAWTGMWAAEVPGLDRATRADESGARLLAAIVRGDGLLCPVPNAAVPGDPDTTSCAWLSIAGTGRPIGDVSPLEALYDPERGLYRTFLFEREGSISTNIHMAALLHRVGASDRLHEVLGWLTRELINNRRLTCKWHASPLYVLGETARIMARITTSDAQELCAFAVDQLLEIQHLDGGWGLGGSSVEETSYALLGLAIAAPGVSREDLRPALQKGVEALSGRRADDRALWIAKTLHSVPLLTVRLREIALASSMGLL